MTLRTIQSAHVAVNPNVPTPYKDAFMVDNGDGVFVLHSRHHIWQSFRNGDTFQTPTGTSIQMIFLPPAMPIFFTTDIVSPLQDTLTGVPDTAPAIAGSSTSQSV